jgi:chemotaxis protein MotA
MNVFIGIGVVLGCVFGGYYLGGGHIPVLWQPTEFLIILGAAVGAFIIGNPKAIRRGIVKKLIGITKGPKYKKEHYVELLVMLNAVFKLAKTKGDLALESHVEKPDESAIFSRYPGFNGDHHTREFLCDYLRLLTLGTNNAHEVEAIIDAEIEAHHHHARSPSPRPSSASATRCRRWASSRRCWASSTPWARSPSRRRCWAN